MCIIILFLCSVVGLLMYAKYFNCDPLKIKLVTRSDQVKQEEEEEEKRKER